MDAHLRDLRYFVMIAEELSFTRAADRLHVSQPALSKQIGQLEAALGGRLFSRERRQILLTEAGRRLLERGQRLLAEWDDTVAAVAAAVAEEGRVLRVGTLTALGRGLYRAVIDEFTRRQPGWRIDLVSRLWSDPTGGLGERATDAAFVWLPVDDTDLCVANLVTEPRMVAVGDRHPLAHRSEIAFGELLDEPFVALPEVAGKLRDFWLAKDARDGHPVRVAAVASTADETFESVSVGRAVVLLAQGNAEVYARPGIACIPVTGIGPANLAVAWRRDDRRPVVEAFVSAATEAARRGNVQPTALRLRTNAGGGNGPELRAGRPGGQR